MTETQKRWFRRTEVKVSSDVSGEVVELYVEEGDTVKAGQLLAKIDPEAYVSAVERGAASVNTAKAQAANSRSAIEQAKAQKEQVEAQLANQRDLHRRNEQLHKEKVISDTEYEQSLAALRGLEANLRFAGPETMELKIFARLTAWQNWIFQRPNAVGPEGALSKFGTGERPAYDMRRV